MGDGTKENPYTREDVGRLIEEHGGSANGLDLSGKVFEDGVDLRDLDLQGIILKKAYLWDTRLQGAELRGAHLERATLSAAHLERATLFDAHLEGAILFGAYLEGADLAGAHLEGAFLAGAEFSSDTILDNIDWGNFILKEEKGNFFKEEKPSSFSFRIAADTYRRLKMWYTNAGVYDIAGTFFYREMEAKRKAQSWKKEPASKLWSWVMRLLCGYGERYGNVVVAALVIIFGLAVVYGFGGLNLAYAIYFSAVSFTALGYGSWVDITPQGWVQGLGAAESFVGVFMMALFLVTFVRKMTR